LWVQQNKIHIALDDCLKAIIQDEYIDVLLLHSGCCSHASIRMNSDNRIATVGRKP